MATEMVVASKAKEIAAKKLTPSELEFIEQLDKADSVEVLMPEDVDAAKFKTAVGAICKSLVKAQRRTDILFPVLGRLMLVAKLKPELWKKKEEDTYEDWVESLGEQYGVSRPTLYEARKIVMKFGQELTIEDFADVGRTRMRLLAKIVPNGEEKQTVSKKLLNVAKTGSREELETMLEANYHKNTSDTIGEKFCITGSKRQASHWRKFFENPKIHAHVGTDDAAEIMEMLVAECETEWIEAGEVAMKKPDKSDTGAA